MYTKLLGLCLAVVIVFVGCEFEPVNRDADIISEPTKNETDGEVAALEYFYYVTPYGRKYHLQDCSYIQRDLSECRKFTDITAESYGYSPCFRCIG